MPKYELEDASVYLHVPDDGDNATVEHIDICHPMVGTIIGNDNSSYVGGMPNGAFIGLKDDMRERFLEIVALFETNNQITEPETQ